MSERCSNRVAAYVYSRRYAGVPPECQACGANVSRRFIRVFGNNDGTVYACRECATWEGIKDGAGIGPDADGTAEVSVRPTLSRGPDSTDSETGRTHERDLVNWTQMSPANSRTADQRGNSSGPSFADLLG